jgi:hypothetical protein
MSDATYLVGTDEYVVWKIECITPGETFSPAEWTAVGAMVPLDQPFVDDATPEADPSVWTDAVLSLVNATKYGRAKLVDLLDPVVVGKYRILTRLTKTGGGAETPLLKAEGRVTVKAP